MSFCIASLERLRPQWDVFVASQASACIYHDARWKDVIERTFRHPCHYLAAEYEGQVQGILPLVEMRGFLFGHFLVSLPFLTYGGVAARSEEASLALSEAAIRLARQLRARHVELRQHSCVALPWASRRHKVALTVTLPDRVSQLWDDLSSRLRGKIRKASRHAAFTISGPEAITAFYSVFRRNMRDLGTPVYPLRFFEHIGRSFASAVRVFLVRLRGRAVAAAFSLEDGPMLRLPWICSDRRYGPLYVTEFLYWSVLEWASSRGLSAVDLGRSTLGGGSHRFKRQFHPREEVLTWYYWAPEGSPLPDLSPENPRLRWAVRLWRRLPLVVANALGPRIVRNLP